jgi:hypothetical protein
VIVSSRTTIAVGQGEAETEAAVEIERTGETVVGEATQNASGLIDRTGRIDLDMVIDRTVSNVLTNLTVPNVRIIPEAGEIVDL